jgi:hypothetical protein
VSFTPNPEEVSEARWFSQDEIKGFCEDGAQHGELISPWFGEIEHLLLCAHILPVPLSRSPTLPPSRLPALACGHPRPEPSDAVLCCVVLR